jgi:hypothetical protein
MAIRFVNIDRDTPLLLPPDLRDWVPADHWPTTSSASITSVQCSKRPEVTRGSGIGGQKQRLIHKNEKLDRRQTENPGKCQHRMIPSKMAQPFCLAAWRTKSDTLLGAGGLANDLLRGSQPPECPSLQAIHDGAGQL